MHLRHFRIRRETVDRGAAWDRVGRNPLLPPPQHSVPCTEVEPQSLLLRTAQSHGSGRPKGQRCVRSPRVIANSKERRSGGAGGRGQGG